MTHHSPHLEETLEDEAARAAAREIARYWNGNSYHQDSRYDCVDCIARFTPPRLGERWTRSQLLGFRKLDFYLQDAVVHGKRIEWAPRPELRAWMDDNFQTTVHNEYFVAKRDDVDTEARCRVNGLIGEPNESLRHRATVAAFAWMAYNVGTHSTMYPVNNDWVRKPDVTLYEPSLKHTLGVEVVMEGFNRDDFAAKFREMPYELDQYYIFQNGQVAARALNVLAYRELLPPALNFPKSNPKHWSPKQLHEEIERAQREYVDNRARGFHRFVGLDTARALIQRWEDIEENTTIHNLVRFDPAITYR